MSRCFFSRKPVPGLVATIFFLSTVSCIRENRDDCYAPKVFSVEPSELTVGLGHVDGRFIVKSNSPEPVSWSFSDSTVARLVPGETASEFVVEPLRCGETSVFFSVPESWGSEKFYRAASAEAKLTVVDSVNVRLSIASSGLTVDVGETAPVPFTVSPDIKVSWKTLNPDVASVDTCGVVTGISPGKTSVVASAGGYVSGDYKLFGFASDTCAVTVMGDGLVVFDTDTLSVSKGASATVRIAASSSPVTLSYEGSGTVFSVVGVETSSGMTLTVSGLSRGRGVILASIAATETSYAASDTLVVRVSEDGGLVLQPSDVVVAEGGFVTVRAMGPSSGKIVWTVDDTSVADCTVAPSGAEVSVSGVSAGKTVLRASQAEWNGYSASEAVCSITVTGETSLSLSDTVVVFDAPGENRTITASVNGGGVPQWSVSPSGVVSSSAGTGSLSSVLTALAPGQAVVTVSVGATEFYTAAKAYCRVSVRDDPHLALSPASLSMTKVNESAVLTASTLSPAPLEWSCSDPDVAVLSGGGNSVTLTALRSGSCTVTVSQGATDSFRAASASCTVSVDIIPSFVDGRWLYYNGAGELVRIDGPGRSYGTSLDVNGGDGTVRWKLRYDGDIPDWVRFRINGSAVSPASDGSLGGWRTGDGSVDVSVDEFYSFVDARWADEDPMTRRAYLQLVLEDGRVPQESGVSQTPAGGYKLVLEEGTTEMGPEGGEAVIGFYCSGYVSWFLKVTLAFEPSGGSYPPHMYDVLWTEALAYLSNGLGWYSPGYSPGYLQGYIQNQQYFPNRDYIGGQIWYTNCDVIGARYKLTFKPNSSSYTRVFTIENDPDQSGAKDLSGPLVFRVRSASE